MTPAVHALSEAVPDPNVALILQRLDQQDGHLREIKVQVQLTNGRVKSLELWRARWDGVSAAVSWVPTVATGVVVGTIVAIVSAVL
jgi:hypothetical protein